jgi:asparagine synthetase B (glutamine-hydrolysing)
MCGITALFHQYANSSNQLKNSLLNSIKSRGPNIQSNILLNKENLWVGSSVLHIQGDDITIQPYEDSDGNILLWNGEVFHGLQNEINCDIKSKLSDTVIVSNLLRNKILNYYENIIKIDDINNYSLLNDIGNVVTLNLSNLHGPYAFFYYHKLSDSVFFGRDPFGRRSLLLLRSMPLMADESKIDINIPFENSNIYGICSVDPCLESNNISSEIYKEDSLTWDEVEVTGIFAISLRSTLQINVNSQIKLHIPWPSNRVKLGRSINISSNIHLGRERASELFLDKMKKSVKKRVDVVSSNYNSFTNIINGENNIKKSTGSNIGVLFSGGIDSVFLAALLHLTIDERDSIDLMNVTFIDDAFDKKKSFKPSPDRLAAIIALCELKLLYPSRTWNLVHIDVTSSERQKYEDHVKNLIRPADTHMDLNIGKNFKNNFIIILFLNLKNIN